MENQIWQGLDEIRAFSILSRELIESHFDAVRAAVGEDCANSLFSGLQAIAQKSAICQKAIEMIESEKDGDR